jgi:hypothetical protein
MRHHRQGGDLKTDKSALVQVKDRGPMSRSRVMDVTPRVAEQLGMIRAGARRGTARERRGEAWRRRAGGNPPARSGRRPRARKRPLGEYAVRTRPATASSFHELWIARVWVKSRSPTGRSHRLGDRGVAEEVLDQPRIGALVGQGITGGVPQPVRMDVEAQLGQTSPARSTKAVCSSLALMLG